MALYLVVHHRQDPHQTFRNIWQNDGLLTSIQTTLAIGELCSKEKDMNNRVYIHRCGCRTLGFRPMICCSVRVAEVTISHEQAEVQFEDQREVNCRTKVQPEPGQSNYSAPPP